MGNSFVASANIPPYFYQAEGCLGGEVTAAQGMVLLLFMSFGAALGWYLGTKRVRRRSLFGDDYAGSSNHRQSLSFPARRQVMRLLSAFLYGMGGVLAGFVFLVVTRRR